MAACAWTIIACVGLLGDAAWQSPPLTLSLSSLHPSSPFPNAPISSLPSLPPFPQQQKAALLLLSNTTCCHLRQYVRTLSRGAGTLPVCEPDRGRPVASLGSTASGA